MTTTTLSSSIRTSLVLTLPLIGACSSAGQFAKGSLDSSSSYYGEESFTLVATSPANLGLVSKAQYLPETGQSCKTYSPGLGGEVSRRNQKTDEIAVGKMEQTAEFNIPLSYHIAGCQMELIRIDLSIEGKYGPTPLDIGGDVAGFSISGNALPNQTRGKPTSNNNFQWLCTWMFQLSVARIEKNGISKVLSCSAASSDWSVPTDYIERSKSGGKIEKSTLKNSSVNITFRLSPDEEPSMANRWIKTEKGWKPCQATENSNRCQTPPSFKKFKMNGRACTVYPTCTE